MKLSTLLAGAAALAMVTGSAQAGVIAQGSTTIAGVNSNNPGVIAGAVIANIFGADLPIIGAAGLSVGNTGTAANTATAAFTLKGEVSKDCVFYTGSMNTTLDFGQIGINASANSGPGGTFDQVAPAFVTVNTNTAGCNTRNLVTVAKTNPDGMHTNNGGSFDTNQFTNVLPYTVAASWTGVDDGSFAVGAKSLNLAVNEQTKNTTQGAWKSSFNVNVVIPVQPKSLVSGVYQDTLTVTLQAL